MYELVDVKYWNGWFRIQNLTRNQQPKASDSENNRKAWFDFIHQKSWVFCGRRQEEDAHPT